VKFHFAYYSLIEGNLIRDTDGFGIWMDNTFYKCRITRNVIVNNYFAGVFPELAEGPLLIDNNVIAYTRHADGIYAHDSSGFTIANNLIYPNANYGIWTRVATDRRTASGPVQASHLRVFNNLIFTNHVGAIGLPFPWEGTQDNLSDSNLFVGGGAMDAPMAPNLRYHGEGSHIPTDKIAAAFAAALDGMPADQRPDVKSWIARPDLTLEQWRAFSGNDKDSLATRLSGDMLGLHTVEVRFNFSRGRDRAPIEDLWAGLRAGVPAYLAGTAQMERLSPA